MLCPISLLAQIQKTDLGFQQPNGSPIGIYWKNQAYLKESAAIRAVDFASYAQQGIGFFTGNFADQTSDALERMRITRDGKVGIGTQIPQANLEIQNSGNSVSLKIRHANELNPSWGLTLGQNEDLSGFLGCSGKDMQIKSGWNKKLILGCEEYNNYKGVVVFPGGNVGIGINVPSFKLDVAGTIRATEIKVEAQTADFVFEPDYKLRPLDEVEIFVKENKHLPEIPSAKQMEAVGVNVAEMNKLLLQKVEELTLYIIELKKEVNQLKKRELD